MNNSRTTHAFRLSPLGATLSALALLLPLALAAPACAGPSNDSWAPDLGDCQILKVPAGNKVSFHAFGVGVQIYQWNGTSWTFVAPEALLFADDSEVGIHFRGPTWLSNDGSIVAGTVLQSCTPNPDAIPWLLLRAAFTEGSGVFGGVTYLQRLNTVGGKAPSEPGNAVGEVASVPYTADYFFYRRQN